MKRFLKELSIALTLFICMDFFAVPAFISGAFKNLKNDYFEFKKTDVLFLGDSHGSFAFDPDVCSQFGLRCANYSYGGHYWEFQYFFYRKFRNEVGPPKTVVISIPFFSFKNKSELKDLFFALDEDSMEDFFYDPEERQLTEYARSLYLLEPNLFKYRDALSRGIITALWKTLTGTQHPVRYIGFAIHGEPRFQTYDLSQNRLLSATTTPSALHTKDLARDGYFPRESENRKNLRDFRKLMALLAQDGVKTLLVETPEYIDTQKLITGADAFYGAIQEEINPYPGIRLVRQRETPEIDSGNPQLFFDGGYHTNNSHLSLAGSKIYTAAILRRFVR